MGEECLYPPQTRAIPAALPTFRVTPAHSALPCPIFHPYDYPINKQGFESLLK